MQKHNLKLSNRILGEQDYKYSNTSQLSLKDKIVAYYNGLKWRVVPLYIFLSYPVIYDKYYNEENNLNIPISICVCPFTLASCIFEGKFIPSEYILNSILVLTNEKNILLPIITNYMTEADNTLTKIKRWQCSIKLLRNAISDHPDCQFMIPKINLDKQIINKEYYNNNKLLFSNEMLFKNNSYEEKNKIHPKTLVHILQYESVKTLGEKYTIIIGLGKNIEEPSGYNIKESGFNGYLEEYDFKLKEKSGFIIPILWFPCLNIYPILRLFILNIPNTITIILISSQVTSIK